MGSGQSLGFGAKKSASRDAPAVTRSQGLQGVEDAGSIIQALQVRQSILPSDGPYAKLAKAVMATDARTGQSDLQAARLRAEAASKNWLPTIGPSISLTSLGSVVSTILVEQVLFDNGRKKAERAFAAADVEAVAVTLTKDTNNRVEEALQLYLKAQRADDEAALARSALKRMRGFENIIQRRMEGGVSDISDLRVAQAKVRELEAEESRAQQASATAWAELSAMAGPDAQSIKGAPPIGVFSQQQVKPLGVLAAEAQKDRDIAQALMTRAGLLPGLTASGSLGSGGSDVGMTAGTSQGIGFGTGAQLQAVEAAKEAAGRRVMLARENANRTLRRLSQELTAVESQEHRSIQLVADAQRNLDVFQSQFRSGGRSILDVVGMYEGTISAQQVAIGQRYDRLRLRLKIASEIGVLVDGAKI